MEAAGIGLIRHDTEAGGAEEVLRDRAPQVPQRLDGGVFFLGDEGLGVEAQDFAKGTEELGGRMQPDRRLKIGAVEILTELAAILAIHADVRFGIGQLRHIGQMAAEREAHVDLSANAFDEAADLCEVRPGVEGAVNGSDDVDAGLLAFLAGLESRHLLLLDAEFRPQPVHGAVSGLPLVLVDGARQEALDACSLRRHTAADHLGDGTGDDHTRHRRIEHLVGAAHGALGAMLAEFFLGEAGDDDGQFMRGEGVSVVQHRGDGQVLATHRAVDDHLQSLDGGEDVD